MTDELHYPPQFSRSEFLCSHCGAEGMRQETLDRLGRLRMAWGKPIIITSGYRCPQHPIEAAKRTPGEHAKGCAVDIRAVGPEAFELIKLAIPLGYTGIGVSQREGQPRYLHLDDGHAPATVWCY